MKSIYIRNVRRETVTGANANGNEQKRQINQFYEEKEAIKKIC